ncbi:MAG: isocitrate lyase/PEP mutase family protein [Lachnospiraceae bacterium]|nr:isocitrate lyase/PEP mutase family protein [Lachnospiraceae bacterium]
MEKAKQLRALLKQESIIVVPGVTTPLFAKVAEEKGFRALFVTGAGLANMNFGLPDYGLITMTENLELVKRINDNTSLPLIVDIDDGYGSPMNVYRTVKEYSRLNVGAVILEDQKAPKRCGHFEDHEVISIQDMTNKLKAAREASLDPDLVLFARTDAISVNGIEDALERGKAYAAAGADVIFIEAPRTLEQMAQIPKEIPVPTLINLVENGKTPMLKNCELEQMGFKVVLYANAPLKACIKGMQNLFDYLMENGTTDGCDGTLLIPSSERHELTHKQFYMDLQKRYQ